MPQSPPPSSRRPKIVTALIETFGFSPLLATLVALFLAFLAGATVLWIYLSAPPRTLTITSGPPGSLFERYAGDYQKVFAERGVTLRIVPSGGSRENLERLQAAESGVDVGFVQGGLVGGKAPRGLVSLGSVAYQPMWVFYRSPTPIIRLSELAGKRLGIGASGSGVQTLARTVLEANGIAGAPTTLIEQASEGAGNDLLAGKLDALFLMGDSAPLQTLRALMRAPSVQLYSFTQADAYVRRMSYLNKIILLQGSIDFGRNFPRRTSR
ncbi:MAG: hypothetical protein RIQ93_1695 [Verrucomicrobiota bacterium]|jgi:TRAP-type uncharacterized transport system substrate-binding protein